MLSAMDNRTKYLLGKMVGLLGSDYDGEVVAAARQIKRLLESKGLSFGDLVCLVSGGSTELELANELVSMAESILVNESMMRAHEARFVRDVVARARVWLGFKMSDKQARWFSYLYAKYGNA